MPKHLLLAVSALGVKFSHHYSTYCTESVSILHEIKTLSYFAAWLQPENLQCRGNDHPLLFVIGRWDTFKSLEPLHGILATFGFVRYHTANGTPENFSGSTEVEGSTQGFDVTSEAQELQILQLVSVKVTAHIDGLTSDHNDFVAI